MPGFRKHIIHMLSVAIVSALATAVSGCFTGVESTPKITYKDVRSNNAAVVSPEKELAARFVAQPFAQWSSGKRFYVTSPRISLALTAALGSDAVMPQAGDTIRYSGITESVGLTGDHLVELRFGPAFGYRTNATAAELRRRGQMEVPFTVDLDLVDSVASHLVGRTLWVRTPLWFAPDGEAYAGRKFVQVKVTEVLPANEVYPVKVLFSDDQGETHALFMSAGNPDRSAPRDFEALFSLSDIRASYPAISDEMWRNIVNTRPAVGMTKPEAILAIGSPASIDRGHTHSSAYERWNYTDGRYLVFEDGLLLRIGR